MIGAGMNTGIQDVHNLAWKLAAVLKDIASPSLLNTYEIERRPVISLCFYSFSINEFWLESSPCRHCLAITNTNAKGKTRKNRKIPLQEKI